MARTLRSERWFLIDNQGRVNGRDVYLVKCSGWHEAIQAHHIDYDQLHIGPYVGPGVRQLCLKNGDTVALIYDLKSTKETLFDLGYAENRS